MIESQFPGQLHTITYFRLSESIPFPVHISAKLPDTPIAQTFPAQCRHNADRIPDPPLSPVSQMPSANTVSGRRLSCTAEVPQRSVGVQDPFRQRTAVPERKLPIVFQLLIVHERRDLPDPLFRTAKNFRGPFSFDEFSLFRFFRH